MSIKNVAVIGAGVMGSGIAAQIANASVDVMLLDMVSTQSGNRNMLAEQAIKRLLKMEPQALMHKNNARKINTGNIEDDLKQISHADWVIEAVVEKLEIKQLIYKRLHNLCPPHTLISSNTSTIPLHLLSKGMPDAFRKRFLITHFFNPPRYMRLLEVVASDELEKKLLHGLIKFADITLGKGCVRCKDSPGFIANRIGTFWIQTALLQAFEEQLSIEQCDAAMSLFGVPKTGVFGLLDLVGLDLMPFVLDGFKHTLPADDELVHIAQIPTLMQNMLDKGLIGRKGAGGFYRLHKYQGKRFKQAIDLTSGEYYDSERFRLKQGAETPEALRHFLLQDQPLNRYCLKVWMDTLGYAAHVMPDIADTIEAVDNAMRWGYNWRYGPFELIDRLGCQWFAEHLNRPSHAIPALVADNAPLYQVVNNQQQFKAPSGQYQALTRPEGIVLLHDIKTKSKPLLSSPSASLWDIGDACVCLEFHSKMNTLDPDILKFIQKSIDLCSLYYKAMVIYNEGDNFSAGANLTLLMPAINNHDFDEVRSILQLGQHSFQMLKNAPFPVVGAPSGLALGGGCEILLHCDAIQAHAELYMGLVEVGVGLVPAWGGCKELLQRWMQHAQRPGGALPPIAKVFQIIGMASVSTSAQEAKNMLFLSADDKITMNRDRLLADAKDLALSLVKGYQPRLSYNFELPGKTACAALSMFTRTLQLLGKVSSYDVKIAHQLAHILSGGHTDITQPCSEQDILDLEVEAFLSLVQQEKTHARLQHMLSTGKPLRN